MNDLKDYMRCTSFRAKDFIDSDKCCQESFCAFEKPRYINEKNRK